MTKHYTKILKSRDSVKIRPLFVINYPKWFNKTFNFKNKKVLDFGSNIESNIYKKTKQDKGRYYGYDVDKIAVKWLKNKKYFIEFWKTKEKFDIIMAAQVYEHLSKKEQENFIKRSFSLLNKNGLLLIDYPYFANLNGLRYFEDRNHNLPPSVIDELLLINIYKFNAEAYLVGLPKINWFRTILNLILGFYPQDTVQIVAKKI